MNNDERIAETERELARAIAHRDTAKTKYEDAKARLSFHENRGHNLSVEDTRFYIGNINDAQYDYEWAETFVRRAQAKLRVLRDG